MSRAARLARAAGLLAATTAIPSTSFTTSAAARVSRAEEATSSSVLLTVVLTGGPCGGKSSSLEHIVKVVRPAGPRAGEDSHPHVVASQFRERGYDVYTIPEIPTIVIGGGALYPGVHAGDRLTVFETAIMRLQLQAEDSFRMVRGTVCLLEVTFFTDQLAIVWQVARSTGRPSLIVHDRGVLDVSAYIPAEPFQAVLDANHWQRDQLRDRYDLVIHLVTAADGAEAFYTTANNAARSESADEARALDARTFESYAGHPRHARVRNGPGGFKGKLQAVIDEIDALLAERESGERV